MHSWDCDVRMAAPTRVAYCSLPPFSAVMFTVELCPSLADILVLAGTAGAGIMAPPASIRISAMMNCVQGHGSRVNVCRQGIRALSV